MGFLGEMRFCEKTKNKFHFLRNFQRLRPLQIGPQQLSTLSPLFFNIRPRKPTTLCKNVSYFLKFTGFQQQLNRFRKKMKTSML